ncbi:MAG: DUF692 family protein [Candidatus Nitrosocaldus sp.]
MNIPDRGIGITYFLSLEPFIESNMDVIDVVEVEPQNFWLHTLSNRFRMDDDISKRIMALPCKKIVHSVSIPVGGSVTPDPQQVSLLAHIVDELDAAWASEHLAFNRARVGAEIFNTGFLLPPSQTEEGVEYAIRSIRAIMGALSVPFAVETGVNYLKPNEHEFSDGEFIARIVKKAGCGILLDLHNIWTNEMNGRQRVDEFIEDIPLDMVWEVHLAGGVEEDGYWLDAHAGAIPEDLLRVAERIIPRLKNLHAIIFELYPSYYKSEVTPELVREQLEILHDLWDINKRRFGYTNNSSVDHIQRDDSYDDDDVCYDNVGNSCSINTMTEDTSSSSINSNSYVHDYNGPYEVEEWEYTLGRLVIGYEVNTELGRRLSADKAIPVYRRLISSFRSSMLIRALPFTSRLLMLSSIDYEELLSSFWSNNAPALFTTDEALSFLNYIEGLDLDIPYIKDVVALERAILVCRVEDDYDGGKSEEVSFDYDPTILLGALIQRRIPTEINRGRFRIVVSSAGLRCIKVSDDVTSEIGRGMDMQKSGEESEMRSSNH